VSISGYVNVRREVTVENVFIVVLLTLVIFLVWERFHYRQRISDLYDVIVELTAELDPKFELRSHPALRRYFMLDAILDDMGAKLALLARTEESSPTDTEGAP
jgi:hypothetical protein